MTKYYAGLFLVLAVIAATTTEFYKHVRSHSEPIAEIEVRVTPKPRALIYSILKARCGEPRIGRLGEFIECRDEFYLEFFG